jgi:hypothetical protein
MTARRDERTCNYTQNYRFALIRKDIRRAAVELGENLRGWLRCKLTCLESPLLFFPSVFEDIVIAI